MQLFLLLQESTHKEKNTCLHLRLLKGLFLINCMSFLCALCCQQCSWCTRIVPFVYEVLLCFSGGVKSRHMPCLPIHRCHAVQNCSCCFANERSVAMLNAAQLNCAEPVAHGAKHTKVDPFYRSFFANAAVPESFCFTLT